MALRELLASFGIEVKTEQLKKGGLAVDGLKTKIEQAGKDSLGAKIKAQLIDIGKGVVAAFAVQQVFAFGQSVINLADETREASIALGLGTRQLQQLEFAAGTAGVGVEELRAHLARLQRVAAGSAEGKGQAGAFKELGIELKNADGTLKASGQLFEEAGIAIGQIENPTKRAGVASELFGKSYAKLLPLFSEGRKGIDKLKAEAEALGLVFDDAFLANADAYNDNITALKGGLQGLAIGVIGPLLPLMIDFTKGAISITKTVVGWAKRTRILHVALALLAAKGMAMLIAKGAALVTKGGGWIKMFERLRMSILRTALPLIIIEDILAFLLGGKSVTGDLFDRVLGAGATKTVQEVIAAFLGAPDKIGLAWQGLLLGLELVWTGVKFGFLLAASSIADAFAAAWNTILSGAQAALNAVVDVLNKVPGMSKAATGLAEGAAGLETFKAEGGTTEVITAARDAETLALAGKMDKLRAKYAADKEAEAQKIAGEENKVGVGADGVRTGSTTVGAPAATRKATAPKKPALLPAATPADAKAAAAFDGVRAGAAAPPALAPITNNTEVKQNVTQTFTFNGEVAPSTAGKIGRAAKSGTSEALDLRGTQAALTHGAGT